MDLFALAHQRGIADTCGTQQVREGAGLQVQVKIAAQLDVLRCQLQCLQVGFVDLRRYIE